MLKLGRNYLLTISGTSINGAPIVPFSVALPFTIEFDITRNTLTSANVCQIRLYNLSQQNRNQLAKNETSGWGNPFINITLQAGYGTPSTPLITNSSQLPVIFSGGVSRGWSVREGVNFITQLECYDGGFAFITGKVNQTFPAGTPKQVIIANLISALPGIQLGAIGNYSGVIPKQVTYSGNSIQVLNQLTGDGFFIDNGIGNALSTSEYSLGASPPKLINASVGLLNTPIREQNLVRFEMIFEPTLVVGSGVQLLSSTDQNFNGTYKVTSVKHRGMISETVCGDAITTGEFFALQQPIPVVNYAGQ